MHFTNPVNHTGVAKNTLCRRRFTGIDVCRNTKISL
jgi:hypothetical protein